MAYFKTDCTISSRGRMMLIRLMNFEKGPLDLISKFMSQMMNKISNFEISNDFDFEIKRTRLNQNRPEKLLPKQSEPFMETNLPFPHPYMATKEPSKL